MPGFRLRRFHYLATRLILLGHSIPAAPAKPASPGVDKIAHIHDAIQAQIGSLDEAAGVNADKYRSAYWAMYLLAPLAIVFAALSIFTELNYLQIAVEFFVVGKLVVLLAILLIFLMGKYGQWHKRWLSARIAVEHFRYLPLISPFVGNNSGNWYSQDFQVPEIEPLERFCRQYTDDGNEVLLDLSDSAVRNHYLVYLRNVLEYQAAYHQWAGAKQNALVHRIHLLEKLLFAATMACVIAHFWWHFVWLSLVATVFPSLGASLQAILAQGESSRIATRSDHMSESLEKLAKEVEGLMQSDSIDQSEFKRIVINAIRELLNEANDWQNLISSKHLVLPG